MVNVPLLVVGLGIGWLSRRSFDVAMIGLFGSIGLTVGSFLLLALDVLGGEAFVSAFVVGMVLLGIESVLLKTRHDDEFQSWWRRTRRRAMGQSAREHYR